MPKNYSLTICPACDNEIKFDDLIPYAPTSMNNILGFKEAGIYTCSDCRFSGIAEEISKAHLTEYYTHYYNGKAAKAEAVAALDLDMQATTMNLNPRYIAQIQLIRQFLPLNQKTKILEIGCGKGDLFNILKNSRVGGDFFALEPQKATGSILDRYGVQVIEADITSECKQLRNFDLIVMSHSLEHFNPSDLKMIFNNVRNALRPGGYFLCEVPNADLKAYANASENLVPHLSFFTKRAISLLCKKYGLVDIYLECLGPSQTAKQNTAIIANRLPTGYYADHRVEGTVFFKNKNTQKTHTKISKRAKIRMHILRVLRKILGHRLSYRIFNYIKLIKFGHPVKVLNDETNVVRFDGENIRLLAQKRLG